MRAFLITIFLFCCCPSKSQDRILLGGTCSSTEEYAATELQRYLYACTGQLPQINRLPGLNQQTKRVFTIGTRTSLSGNLPDSLFVGLGEEGYRIRIRGSQIYILAGKPAGCLYGVYGFLEDYLGIGFYLGHDALPQHPPTLPQKLDQAVVPSMSIRGILPWTNFPQSATVYSWEDWRFIIDRAARMRMNFIQVHNYNGEQGHNEMFHNFQVDTMISRNWMPTAASGHGWSCKGFHVSEYRFGSKALFSDYDFGADCALHNESLDNYTVFRKGVSLFQRVIRYAHSRHVKIGLGIDIDLIPAYYGMEAPDPRVIRARVDQVADDYPDLDYLILYISENIVKKPEKLQEWKGIFAAMYEHLRSRKTNIRIAVSGWGLNADIVNGLPQDVIIAPISAYGDGFEPGGIYGNREYWGCPWTEKDFYSSQYYYPFNMHLSNTIKAWQQRAPNMKGLYTLTWRVTDAVDPRISFIARAPWYPQQYPDSRHLYIDYARKNFGDAAAMVMTDIINENEPLSSLDAECQPTGAFPGKPIDSTDYKDHLQRPGPLSQQAELDKAEAQMKTIQQLMAKADYPAQRARMEQVCLRLQTGRDHLLLMHHFPHVSSTDELPGLFSNWIKGFHQRVVDISSLGNIQSVQARYVQERYLPKMRQLRDSAKTAGDQYIAHHHVPFPDPVEGRGTKRGSVLSWTRVSGAIGYHVYANGKRITAEPTRDSMFMHVYHGEVLYRLSALDQQGRESSLSPAVRVLAGTADMEAPAVLVISPPENAVVNAQIGVKAILLDNRADDLLMATLHYRRAGEKQWKQVPMQRRVHAIFYAILPTEKQGLVEYFIVGDDGTGTRRHPVSGSLQLLVHPTEFPVFPGLLVSQQGDELRFKSPHTIDLNYKYHIRIYRSAQPQHQPHPAHYLTYLPMEAKTFRDLAGDFSSLPLRGNYYYTVCLADDHQREKIIVKNIRIAY